MLRIGSGRGQATGSAAHEDQSRYFTRS